MNWASICTVIRVILPISSAISRSSTPTIGLSFSGRPARGNQRTAPGDVRLCGDTHRRIFRRHNCPPKDRSLLRRQDPRLDGSGEALVAFFIEVQAVFLEERRIGLAVCAEQRAGDIDVAQFGVALDVVLHEAIGLGDFAGDALTMRAGLY